jgi:dihydrofolate synthase/folylpolyglutamate synthase
VNYRDVVEILKISQTLQDQPARYDRFEAFQRAISFYGVPLPENGKGVILIAGTNGKGSVAKTLETLIGGAVGLYTSPHLMEPTERIRSHGRDLSEQEMVQVYELVSETVRQFDLSHFEILTLMMIEVFFGGRIRPPVSYAVIEVGVGGRLDPTRAIPHETAVIARIGIDHEAILGSTLPAIAQEKLAIAEGASRLIYLKPASQLDKVFSEARAKFPTCEFLEARSFSSELSFEPLSPSSTVVVPWWTLRTPWGSAPLKLLGDRAVQNTSLALEVLDRSGFDPEPALSRLSDVVWPGRMEKIRFNDREIFLSGDHNEQGIQSLVHLLSHFRYEKLWLVVGIGKGKPIEIMMAQYLKIPDANFILTRTSFRPVEMSAFAPFAERAVAVIENAFDALQIACRKAGPNDLVVVSGSLYLVGDLRSAILSALE